MGGRGTMQLALRKTLLLRRKSCVALPLASRRHVPGVWLFPAVGSGLVLSYFMSRLARKLSDTR
jgi:hypothetical protein